MSKKIEYKSLRNRYLILFIWTLFLSLVYPFLIKNIFGYDKVSICSVSKSADTHKIVSQEDMAESIAHLPEQVKHALHSQSGYESSFQVLTVISISFLWFYAFLVRIYFKEQRQSTETQSASGSRTLSIFFNSLKGLLCIPRRYVVIFLALLPAGIFFASMHNQYQPAVFVMAMVAIFVAAEHYSGLDALTKDFQKETNKLTATLKVVYENAGKLAEDLKEQRQSIEILLYADGIAQWKKQLYEEYMAANVRIDGIFRIFDIDDQWWRAFKQNEDDPWDIYKNPDNQQQSSSQPDASTLYSVLSKRQDKQMPKVLIVADLPFPGSTEWDELNSTSKKYDMFDKFLGLAWQLVIFSEIRKKRKENYGEGDEVPYVRMMISSPPNWLHVMDDRVWEIIEIGFDTSSSDQFNKSRARRLTSSVSPEKNARLSEWARSDIRKHATRGGYAEEYLLSVCRYVALEAEIATLQRMKNPDLSKILEKLGFEDWWRKNQDRIRDEFGLDQAKTQDACCEIFRKLLEVRLHDENAVNISAAEVNVGDEKWYCRHQDIDHGVL